MSTRCFERLVYMCKVYASSPTRDCLQVYYKCYKNITVFIIVFRVLTEHQLVGGRATSFSHGFTAHKTTTLKPRPQELHDF